MGFASSRRFRTALLRDIRQDSNRTHNFERCLYACLLIERSDQLFVEILETAKMANSMSWDQQQRLEGNV